MPREKLKSEPGKRKLIWCRTNSLKWSRCQGKTSKTTPLCFPSLTESCFVCYSIEISHSSLPSACVKMITTRGEHAITQEKGVRCMLGMAGERKTQVEVFCGFCFSLFTSLMCGGMERLGTKQATYPCVDWYQPKFFPALFIREIQIWEKGLGRRKQA